jgi:hypothetical protein
MKTLLVFIVAFFQIIYSYPQDFLAMSITGSVSEKTSGGWRSIRTGQKLKLTAKILVNDNSSIALICPKYSPVRLTKGVYELERIESDSCDSGAYSLTTSYLKYIWTQLTTKKSSPETDHRKFMKNNAAVRRGCPYSGYIKSMSDTLLIYRTDFNLIESSEDQNKSPVLELYADEYTSKKIATYPIKDGHISTAVLRKSVNGHQEMYWTISDGRGNECDRRYMRVVTDKEYSEIMEGIESVSFVARNGKEKAFMTAFILEENHLYGEALSYYRKAVPSDEEL